jgi:multidrug efflux pump subunit AcrA (membrane-fusion protein)
MYRIKRKHWLLCFLLAALLTACGETSDSGEVLLYQNTATGEAETAYESTTVKKGTYKETASGTGSLYYTTENRVSLEDENAYLDKICVKRGQKVKKGDVLAIYHIQTSKTVLKKKKLQMEQAKSEYETELKRKKAEILAKEKSISAMSQKSEKKIGKIELAQLKSEYKQLVRSGRNIRKQEKTYNTLLKKQKRAELRSSYTGTVVNPVSSAEWENTEMTGERLMDIRDESKFLIEVETETGGLRYNMTVNVSLGKTTEDIAYRLKGRVISTDNLYNSGDDDSGESKTFVRISKKDMKKYPLKSYNIYVTGVTLKIKNALMVDTDAVYEETDGDDVKNYVYLLEKGKLHKRYIVSNYKKNDCYLVNQGVEEGQTLAIVRN